jgi:hypothetical protein
MHRGTEREVNVARMKSSKRGNLYLFMDLLLIVNRCFLGDGFACAFRILEQEREVLGRECHLNDCGIALIDRDYEYVEFVAGLSKKNVDLFVVRR